ncbi:lipase [Chlorella sorokiniana]|uniref:Lipase n=1 Tax=Chlorella sorokiniana TaxID=3076 RepID=A0A2P6U317_CHLSO|nr:lipase [Chlorella sorokiniana]|eukprot:PRW60704.1 lipase [Chlorella sorokiniana]
MQAMRSVLVIAALAVCLAHAVSAGRGGGVLPAPRQWDGLTRAKAARLALYSSALRCKWARVEQWSCVDCRALQDTTLLYAHATRQEYDDAADAFTIHHDHLMSSIVVTFRSTYGNSAGWLNNLNGIGVARTIGNKTYYLHRGMSTEYFTTIRGPLMQQLKRIATNPQLSSRVKSITFNGHSRGGAMAVLAAVDAGTDMRQQLGITNPWTAIRLYTMGQPRVGDAAYAALIESLFHERFRIANTADIVPQLPPSKQDVQDLTSPLSTLVRGVVAVRAELPSWLKPLVPDLSPLLKYGLEFVHHGVYILQLDYVNPSGVRVLKDLVCAGSDKDSTCAAEIRASMSTAAKRAAVGPYAWPGAFGAPLNRWPLWAVMDHGWYLGVDVGNERCFGMKPPGWHGWKLGVGTAPKFGAGTNGDISVSWRCGATPATNGLLPLDCKLSLGELLSGDLDDLNCFQGGDIDTFSWQSHNGTALDGNWLPATRPASCAKAGAKPVFSLQHKGRSAWESDAVFLQLGYTSGPNDAIVTKWFGDCTPGIDSSLKFGPGTQTRQLQLCESAPYYRWKLTVATANAFGSGTDGQVQVQLRCGGLNATAPHVPLTCGRPLGGCFERSQLDKFEFTFNPGRWGPTDPLTPARFPLPACTAAGAKLVLTLGFKGNGLLDDWTVDLSKSVIELEHTPVDVTSYWDETTGNTQARLERKRWKPCSGGTHTFPRTPTLLQRDFALCAAP